MAAKSGRQGKNEILCIVTYLLLWLTGILVYITEGQRSKRMKFHALQAIFLGIVVFVISFIPIIRILGLLLWLYGLYVGVMGYNNKDIEMPLIGKYARQYSK